MAEVPAPRVSADPDPLVIACREFVELATDHLEGVLPDHVERAIADHLELCDPCVIYLEQLRRTSGVLRTLPAPTLPPPARDHLLEVFTRLHPPA